MKKIAFDVDGTLIDLFDNTRQEVVDKLMEHQANGDEVYIWSGGGLDYARTIARRLSLEDVPVIRKEKNDRIDICYDDMDVNLAKVNIKI